MGADLEVDVSFQWMRFFCDDDATLQLDGRFSALSSEFGTYKTVRTEIWSWLSEKTTQDCETVSFSPDSGFWIGRFSVRNPAVTGLYVPCVQLGADLEVDVSFQWMRFFCDDDATLQMIEDSVLAVTGIYASHS
jgi:hypothetical protein